MQQRFTEGCARDVRRQLAPKHARLVQLIGAAERELEAIGSDLEQARSAETRARLEQAREDTAVQLAKHRRVCEFLSQQLETARVSLGETA